MVNLFTIIEMFLPLLICLPVCGALMNPSASKGGQMKAKVAILGGGVAGMTAAQTLHKHGIDDFIIIEYNGEIGGRNRHTTFGEKPDGSPYTIEMGSNWVQEISKNNPILQLVRKYNITYTNQNYESVRTYNEKGPIDFGNTWDDYDRAKGRAEAQADYLLKNDRLDQSERAGLLQAGWQSIFHPARQAVEWWDLDGENGIAPEFTSQIFNEASIPGSVAPGSNGKAKDLFVHDQRGFNYFVRAEAAEFLKPNDHRLLLNSAVTNVTYDADGVTVETKDGSSIRAEHAICTFSLGVLQASISAKGTPGNSSEDGIVSFSPPLPAWKQRGIANFGIATYTKVFMQFPREKHFWPKKTQFALYADPTTRGNYPIWQSLSLPNFFPDSGLLFATLVSPNSAQIESQTDEETKQQAVAILRNMFGADNVPEPTAFYFPRWGRMPWARGSFSYWPTGTTLEEHENIRATVGGRLWFAGEHTSSENFGFLHGAWFEGRAAGNRVAKCLKTGNSNACDVEDYYDHLAGSNGRGSAYNRTNGYGVAH